MLVKLLPFILILAFAYGQIRFSAWIVSRQLKSGSAPLKDETLERYARQLAVRAGIPTETVNVRILDRPELNGIAAPDGSIYLTRGFVDRYHKGEFDAEELASVIAHELGHVDLGHSGRRMREAAGMSASGTAVIMLFARLIPVVGVWIGHAVASILSTALGARNSRSDEYEADQFATALMLEAGIGESAQISLLSKLDQSASGVGPPLWLRSHPRTQDRLKAIEAFARRWKGAGSEGKLPHK